MQSSRSSPTTYDFISFGDEVPGILGLVSAAREFRRQTGRLPRSLLLFKSSSLEGIGGHLVRGRLAYLDRSQVPLDLRRSLGLDPFGDPADLYQEFLRRSKVIKIALDPLQADTTLRQMLGEIHAAILSNIEIAGVEQGEQRMTSIRLTNGSTYSGKFWLDASVNAELAQAAGIPKLSGYGVLGLPESELPVTLVFETQGLSVQRLQQIEDALLRRLLNSADLDAQDMLNRATDGDNDLRQTLRQDLVDVQGKPKRLFAGIDYIDVRCHALSIAYHAFRRTKLDLRTSKFILDKANIAVLPNGNLSWNALLCYVTAAQAEAIARTKSRPTPEMMQEFSRIEQWLKSLGATTVTPALELYVRHAGNVTGIVKPLSGAEMLAGGVPASEAIGTFGYHFDIRGGITGLNQRAFDRGFTKVKYNPPLFNMGIQHTLLKDLSNLAVISPASGFDGFASGAGRIIEFNVGVAQGVGIGMALARLNHRSLNTMTNLEIRRVLDRTGKLSRIYGRVNEEYAQLRDFERRLA